MIPAVDRLTASFADGSASRSRAWRTRRASQVTTSSLDALELRGRSPRQRRRGGHPQGGHAFEDAIAKDSLFAMAYVQLAYQLGNAGVQPARPGLADREAYRLRERLPERERYNVEGAFFGRGRPAEGDRRVRTGGGDRLDRLGRAQLRWRSLRADAQSPRAEQLYRRALVVEPENGIIFGNLLGVLTSQAKFDAADSVLRVVRERKILFPLERSRSRPAVHARRGGLRGIPCAGGMKSPNAGFAVDDGTSARSVRCADGCANRTASPSSSAPAMPRGARRSVRSGPIRQALDDGGCADRSSARSLDWTRRSRAIRRPTPRRVSGSTLGHVRDGWRSGPRARRAARGRASASTRPTRRARGRASTWTGRSRLPRRRTTRSAPSGVDGRGDGLPIAALLPLDRSRRAYDQANNADSTIAYLERYLATTIAASIGLIWLLSPAHKRLGELTRRGATTRAR